jgi:hypothetical protein
MLRRLGVGPHHMPDRATGPTPRAAAEQRGDPLSAPEPRPRPLLFPLTAFRTTRYYRELTSQPPIRARHSDGDIKLNMAAGPILCDVMLKAHITQTRIPPVIPLAPKSLPYDTFLFSFFHCCCLKTNCSLNTSPVINIARIILSIFRAVATIAIFLRLSWPCRIRS